MVDSLAQAEAFDWLPLTGFHLLFNIFSCSIRIDFSWTAYCESQLAQVFLLTK